MLILTDNYGQRSRRVSTVVHHLWEADAAIERANHPQRGRNSGKNGHAGIESTEHPDSGGMASVAEKTGGDTIKADDPDDALRAAMRRIRLRYSLYYAMPEAKPGDQRQVKVQLSPDAEAAIQPRGCTRVRAISTGATDAHGWTQIRLIRCESVCIRG